MVVATGLFNKPERPAWAEGLVRPEPPHESDKSNGPWVVDAKDFTDASLAQVESKQHSMQPLAMGM